MVFQKSNPFPKSIFDNVAYGLRINGMTRSRDELRGRVEASLKAAALWDEVKDRLHDVGAGAVRRPAAAAVHRARAGGRAGDPADGRAGVGARPDRDAAHRGADLPAQDAATRSSSSRTTCSRRRACRTCTAFFWLGKLVECDRTEQDLHGAGREADRGLRHRKVRLMASVGTRRPAFPGGARAAQGAAARDGRAGRGAGAPRGQGAGRARPRR